MERLEKASRPRWAKRAITRPDRPSQSDFRIGEQVLRKDVLIFSLSHIQVSQHAKERVNQFVKLMVEIILTY